MEKVSTTNFYGIIYKITNNINGKIYIGQTKNTFNKRYKNNFEKYAINPLLKSDIKQYGYNNFTIDKEIDVALNKDELNQKEIYWIEFYNSFNREYGYNMRTGCHKRKVMNEEDIRKMFINIADRQRKSYNKQSANMMNLLR